MLQGIKELVLVGKKIAEDGKISVQDLVHLIDLAKSVESLASAVKGADQIPKELGDLDQSEVMEIISILYKLVEEINNA